MATTRPSAVSTSASEIPIETAPRPAEPLRADALERVDDADDRAEQPDEGGGRADGRERGDALLQIRGGERRGALNGSADGIEQVFALQGAAAFLLELIFLQAGEHDLREMAITEVLRRRKGHGVLQAAFLDVLGYLRRIQLGLITRLLIREEPLDPHADRPHRHDNQDYGHTLGHDSHRLHTSPLNPRAILLNTNSRRCIENRTNARRLTAG